MATVAMQPPMPVDPPPPPPPEDDPAVAKPQVETSYASRPQETQFQLHSGYAPPPISNYAAPQAYANPYGSHAYPWANPYAQPMYSPYGVTPASAHQGSQQVFYPACPPAVGSYQTAYAPAYQQYPASTAAPASYPSQPPLPPGPEPAPSQGPISFQLNVPSRVGSNVHPSVGLATFAHAQSVQTPTPSPASQPDDTQQGTRLSHVTPSAKAWASRAITMGGTSDEYIRRVKAVFERHKAQGTINIHDWDREPYPAPVASLQPTSAQPAMSQSDTPIAPSSPRPPPAPRIRGWDVAAAPKSLSGAKPKRHSPLQPTSPAWEPSWTPNREARARERSRSPDLRHRQSPDWYSRGRYSSERSRSPDTGWRMPMPPSPHNEHEARRFGSRRNMLTKKQRKQARKQEDKQKQRMREGVAVRLGRPTSSTGDRIARFSSALQISGGSEAGVDDAEQPAVSSAPIVGTCEALEKRFLRLNTAPRAEDVRPPRVITAALAALAVALAARRVDYAYVWNQLKAMRQDLTVQDIRGSVAVAVEEAFARAALEYGDLREYHKCATALDYLYRRRENAEGPSRANAAEFVAYRILAYTCQTHATPDMILRALGAAAALGVGAAPAVCHARAVRSAVVMGNAPAFWRLYASAPGLGRLLMDRGARALRHGAVRALVAGCKTAPAELCASMLGFAVADEAGPSGDLEQAPPLPGCREANHSGAAGVRKSDPLRLDKCRVCLLEHHAVLKSEEGAGGWALDGGATKSEVIVLPEEKDKADYGDTQVDIADFLKQRG